MKKFLLLVVAVAIVASSAYGQGEVALRARIAELERQVTELKAALAKANGSNAAPTAASSGARALVSWKGSGIKTTESFTTTAAEWKVRWKAVGTGGLIQIYVYDSSGGLVNLAANKQGGGSDVSVMHAKPGKYYLTINSFSLDWEVSIEQ